MVCLFLSLVLAGFRYLPLKQVISKRPTEQKGVTVYRMLGPQAISQSTQANLAKVEMVFSSARWRICHSGDHKPLADLLAGLLWRLGVCLLGTQPSSPPPGSCSSMGKHVDSLLFVSGYLETAVSFCLRQGSQTQVTSGASKWY